jgi:LmbE family N-acetylglucosaminyl deacetylase
MTAWAGRRLLLVVAHPDDETFGCGSVIAEAAAGGSHVTVCCATRGEAGELAPGCELGPATLAEARTAELHRAATALGAADVVLLDFLDSGMSGDAGADTLFGAPFDSVVDAVAGVVAAVDPDVVVSLDTAGGDGHRDHTRIGRATVEAVRRWDGGASLYEWCVVRSLLTRWLDALRATAPDRGHLQLDDTELGRPDEDVTTVVDVHAHLDRRRRAIALHASQRSPYDDMPEDLVDAFLGQDRFVRVLPPWSGGPVEAALTVPERVAAAPPRRRLASLEQWVFRRHGAALRRRRS